MLAPALAHMLASAALLARQASVPFQASPSIAASTSFILTTANETIQTNSSHDAAATYLLGIGDTDYATIYSNWPVATFFVRCLR